MIKNAILSLVGAIKGNPVDALVVAIIIIAVVVDIYKNKKDILSKAALYAVTLAEEAWGSNTGKIKFAEVYTYLRKQYPIATFLFTEAQLTKIIEDALIRLKEILASKASVEKPVEEKEPEQNIEENTDTEE